MILLDTLIDQIPSSADGRRTSKFTWFRSIDYSYAAIVSMRECNGRMFNLSREEIGCMDNSGWMQMAMNLFFSIRPRIDITRCVERESHTCQLNF